MRLAIRAAIAVALLVGVYVLAAGVLAATVLFAVLVIHHASAGAFKLLALAVLASAALLRGLWAGLRARRGGGDEGLLMTRDAQPELWAVVDRLAEAVGTRGPDEIRLIPAVNAAVMEDSALLGLRPGKRIMYIGVPLFEAFTSAELEGVLAHELGHYSGRHTALGPLVHRGHVALEQLLVHLRARRFVQRLFLGYAKLYFRVSNGVSRRQEFEADAAAARIAGAAPTISALSRLPSVTAAWKFYLETYISPPVLASVVPSGLASGFRSLIAEPQRQRELAAIGVTERPTSPYDTHPPLHERIAALRAAAGTAEPDDSPPARTLLRDADSIEAAMPGLLLAVPVRVVSWDEAATRVARGESEQAGNALLKAAAGCGAPATLAGVLDVLGRAQAAELAHRLAPGRSEQEQREALRWALRALVLGRLADRGQASWTVSWTGAPWQPSGVDVEALDAQIKAATLASSETAPLRKTLDRLGLTDADAAAADAGTAINPDAAAGD